MFESRNIYVLNKKDPNAIVYEDADGSIIRLTRDQFSSEDEFLSFKAWSDEDYHETEKARHQYSDNTLSLSGLSDEAVAVGSVEDSLNEQAQTEDRERLRCLLMSELDTQLTEVQRRRLWRYVVDGITEERIAEEEGIAQQNISKSIRAAIRKMKKFLENRV